MMPLALAATLPANGQPADSQDATMRNILAGGGLPLTITVKDLNGDYRRMIVGNQSDVVSYQMLVMGAKAGVEFGLYFTKGDTVNLGGETYLIAYRPQVRIDPEVFRQHGHGNDDAPKPTKLRPNTTFALSFLNLRTTASLNDIRPFDPEQDIKSPRESDAASVRSLQQLGQGILTWLQARGRGTLPVMGNTMTPALQRRFYPFVHDKRLWAHPTTEEPYRPNPVLSGKNVNQITNRQYLVVFSEASPGSDGTRAVLFLDGRVERVTPDRWERLQQVEPITRNTSKTVVTTRIPVTVTNDDAPVVVAPPPGAVTVIEAAA